MPDPLVKPVAVLTRNRGLDGRILPGTGKGQIGGSTGKGWRPGVSGNANTPLVPYVLRVTNNGSHLVDVLMDIVDGKGKPKPKPSDRIDAARLLLDRGWGRPVQTTELTGPGGGPIQSMNIMASVDTETLYKLVEMRDQILALRAAQVVEGEPADDKAAEGTVPDADNSRDADGKG